MYETNKVSVELLRVNKQIEAEATDVLYTQNQWVVPVVYLSHRTRHFPLVRRKHMEKWRHVILHFDFRNINGVKWAEIVSNSHKPENAFQSQGARMQYVHDKLLEHTAIEFYHQCFYDPWKHKHLQTLVMDLESLYCPIGCCRLEIMRNQLYVGMMLNLLLYRPKCPDPSKIEIRGLKIQEEEDLVHGVWGVRVGNSTA